MRGSPVQIRHGPQHITQHDVPFTSQYADIGHHEWRARGCGIAALKMVLDYWHDRNVTQYAVVLDTLLREGLEAGSYRDGIGWTHRGLVRIAHRYGYDGFSVDYASNGPNPKTAVAAWDALILELERGPVLASVFSRMDPGRGGGHIIVITGFHDGIVAYNDPEELEEHEGRKLLALDVFLRAFKRRFIIIRPSPVVHS